MEDIDVDVDELRALRDRLVADVERHHRRKKGAGHEFNVNSTPQLRQVLFDELGLTPQKKTKTGFSTDAASLEMAGRRIDHLRHTERWRSCARPTAG